MSGTMSPEANLPTSHSRQIMPKKYQNMVLARVQNDKSIVLVQPIVVSELVMNSRQQKFDKAINAFMIPHLNHSTNLPCTSMIC